MTEIKKSEEPISENSKFPTWIIYLIAVIAIGLFKGVMKGCIKENSMNNASKKFDKNYQYR